MAFFQSYYWEYFYTRLMLDHVRLFTDSVASAILTSLSLSLSLIDWNQKMCIINIGDLILIPCHLFQESLPFPVSFLFWFFLLIFFFLLLFTWQSNYAIENRDHHWQFIAICWLNQCNYFFIKLLLFFLF